MSQTFLPSQSISLINSIAIARLNAEPERLAQISRNNIANSLLKNDWVYRWRDILAFFDLEPIPAMLERKKHLKQLAHSI